MYTDLILCSEIIHRASYKEYKYFMFHMKHKKDLTLNLLKIVIIVNI